MLKIVFVTPSIFHQHFTREGTELNSYILRNITCTELSSYMQCIDKYNNSQQISLFRRNPHRCKSVLVGIVQSQTGY